MADEQRGTFTLSALRAFADDRAFVLEQNAKRRGCHWNNEKTELEVMQAYVTLIDRIAADPAILDRLKARA